MTASTAAVHGTGRPGPSLVQFEALDVNPAEFGHEAHVYVAWCYLREFDVLECINRYRSVLRRLTKKFGAPKKYHETMTWFYMLAIAERAVESAATDWNEFKSRSPELFSRKRSMIHDYYSEGRLMSEVARTSFVLPDLAPRV